MNRFEKQMLSLLKELKNGFGAKYVRAEFEAEGLRIEELLRLKDISVRAGLGLSLKIGGCEGMRDLIESKAIGAETIVAPMIESAFALRKYEQAVNKVYSQEESEFTQFWFNLETKDAVSAADEILNSKSARRMEAVVIERVDLCFSFDKEMDDVDARDITNITTRLASVAKGNGLKTVIGGGVSARSLSVMASLAEAGQLDFYETRKIGFSTDGFTSERYTQGLILALGFEIFFLKNKIQNMQNASKRDVERLGYLEMNYWNNIRNVLPGIE